MIRSTIGCLFSQREMDQSLIKCETRKKNHQLKWSDAGKKNLSRPNLHCHRSAMMINDYIRKFYNCAYMHWYTGKRSIFKLLDEDYGCEWQLNRTKKYMIYSFSWIVFIYICCVQRNKEKNYLHQQKDMTFSYENSGAKENPPFALWTMSQVHV